MHLAASGDLKPGQRGANTFDDCVRAWTWPRRDGADRPSEIAHHDRDFELEFAFLDDGGGIEQVAVLRALVDDQRRAHSMGQAPGLGLGWIVCDFDRAYLRAQLSDYCGFDSRDVSRGRRREDCAGP